MIFKVLTKRLDYENCPVVIRQSGDVFEYITSYGGEIYSSYVIMRRSFMQRIFMRPHSAKEISRITQYMIAMAQTTIEALKESSQH